MFAPPLKCRSDSVTFLFLSYLKYLHTCMNFSFYDLCQHFKSTFESLFVCRFSIYLKCPFLKCPTTEKSFKNALVRGRPLKTIYNHAYRLQENPLFEYEKTSHLRVGYLLHYIIHQKGDCSKKSEGGCSPHPPGFGMPDDNSVLEQ